MNLLHAQILEVFFFINNLNNINVVVSSKQNEFSKIKTLTHVTKSYQV